jgi:hypothetical protein
MLEVIDNEQQMPVAQMRYEGLLRSPTALGVRTYQSRKAICQELRLTEKRKRHEDRAVGKLIATVGGYSHRQSSFADPAWTSQGQQTSLLTPKQFACIGQFLLATNQQSGWKW